MPVKPNDVDAVKSLWDLCICLGRTFCENPLQLIWEGHLQYIAASHLLQDGWTLTFGEPGDKNKNVAMVSYNYRKHTIVRSTADYFNSVDIRASKGASILNLELKTYSSLGRKRGRAGMEKGLKKDLETVKAGRAWFLFIADSESYRSMRGERKGARGPKIKWVLDLPELRQIRDFDPDATFGSENVDRFIWKLYGDELERILCAMWLPAHGDVWRVL